MKARNHGEAVKPAFQIAVEQRHLAFGLQADQLGQALVGGQKPAVPAGEALFQRVAEARERSQQRANRLVLDEADLARADGGDADGDADGGDDGGAEDDDDGGEEEEEEEQ